MISNEEKTVIGHILRLVSGIAGGISAAIFLFYFLLGIGSGVKIIYWDLPLNLDDVLLSALFCPISPFIFRRSCKLNFN